MGRCHPGTAGASNVLWAKRVDCRWGEFSVIEATLNAVRALTQSGAPFDFAVLLSGQDYPIRSNDYIARTLEEERGNCLMYLFPFPFAEWPWRGYHRLPVKRTVLHLAGLGAWFLCTSRDSCTGACREGCILTVGRNGGVCRMRLFTILTILCRCIRNSSPISGAC